MLPDQLADGTGVGVLGPAGGVGDAELSVGDGAGDEVVDGRLLAGVGLPAGNGLLAGDELLVGDGVLAGAGLLVVDGAGDQIAGELAVGGAAVGAPTRIGSVAPAAEPGNSVTTGSAGAGLCLTAAGMGTGAGAGDAAALS